MTESLLQYRDRIERPLLVLLGSFFATVGGGTLLVLAASSQRLPAPPRVVDRLVPFVDLAGLSGGSYSLPMFVFLLLWGTVAFLGGIRYVVGGVFARSALRLPAEKELSRELNHPARAIPALVVYAAVVAWMVVISTPARIDRPGTVLEQAGVLFSQQPELLAVFTGFGVLVLVFTLFSSPVGRDHR